MRELAAEPLFRVWLIGLLAGLAVAVSAAGLYGVVAHSVAARTSEVGVRMALGSTPGRVVSLMMREGLRLAAVGIALGLCGAVAATRAIRTPLFGVPPLDPVSFVGAALLLLFVTVLATYLPARRAARVDPSWHSEPSRGSETAGGATRLRYFSTYFSRSPLLYFSTSNRLIRCAAP